MSKQFLDRSDVVARFKQVSSEGMPECVATDVLSLSSFANCFLHCSLKDGLMNMMTPLLACLGIPPNDALVERHITSAKIPIFCYKIYLLKINLILIRVLF